MVPPSAFQIGTNRPWPITIRPRIPPPPVRTSAHSSRVENRQPRSRVAGHQFKVAGRQAAHRYVSNSSYRRLLHSLRETLSADLSSHGAEIPNPFLGCGCILRFQGLFYKPLPEMVSGGKIMQPTSPKLLGAL